MKSFLSALILTTAFMASPLAQAQSSLDTMIKLTPGQWENSQQTLLAGQEFPLFDNGSGQCLTDAESQLTAGEYLDKLKTGLGSDVTCDFSNMRGSGADISIDMTCSSPSGPSIAMSATFTHSPEQVDVLATGTIDMGLTLPVEIRATTKRVGPCVVSEPISDETP